MIDKVRKFLFHLRVQSMSMKENQSMRILFSVCFIVLEGKLTGVSTHLFSFSIAIPHKISFIALAASISAYIDVLFSMSSAILIARL